VKFVQFSDVHLDASLRESKLALPEEKREQRQREIRQIIADACALARERGCDLILIPGDLFDDESARLDTIYFLIETFESVSPLPILVTPGNHDPYLPQSPYNSDFLADRGMRPWPGNVHIFSAEVFQTVRLPQKKDVTVTGVATPGRTTGQNRAFAKRLVPPQGQFNLLLFHGSREPFPPGKEATMPFSEAELLSQGFDYAAVGHYHSYAETKDERGQIRGAYSGTPASQKLNEAGEKFILLGEVSDEKVVSLEKVKMDPRTLHTLEVNCSGLTHTEAVIRKITEEVRKVSQDRNDMLFVRLVGRLPHGSALELPAGFLSEEYFHVAVDLSGLKPDYDLEGYLREPELMRTVEGEFVKTLLNRQALTQDEKEKRVIESAVYYGLDALIEKKISGRYED
jgi:exonuclease SbcD